jgi:hypothetical protein
MTAAETHSATRFRSHRTLTPWARPLPPLTILGVAVPFIVALVCAFIDLSVLFLPWVAFLLGVLSAALLRSWWALLVVPVAVTLGTLPKIMVISHGLPDMASPGFIAGVILFLLAVLVTVTIGAAIGVPLGHELERQALSSEHRSPTRHEH